MDRDRNKENKDKRVTISLRQNEYDELVAKASELNMAIRGVARIAIRKFLQDGDNWTMLKDIKIISGQLRHASNILNKHTGNAHE